MFLGTQLAMVYYINGFRNRMHYQEMENMWSLQGVDSRQSASRL